MDRNLNLDKLLSEYMARRHLKAPTLARLVTERGFPLHRSSVRNWLSGDARKTRDWRPIVAMAEVLYLNREETDVLLQAAGHLPVAELWKEHASDERDHKLLSRWAESVHERSDEKRTTPFLAPPRLPYKPIGRDELLLDLKQQLFTCGNLALHGIPGVGKTTLAAHLAHDPEVRDQFKDGILWARLGRDPNVLAILGTWAVALGFTSGDFAKRVTIEDRKDLVRAAIGEKQMLLVVDDAWKPRDALAFQIGSPNCAHLLTTRQLPIARDFAVERVISVHELNPDAGLELLEKLAPAAVAAEPETAKELVEATGRLPLALYIMGRYLQKESGQPHRLHEALERLRAVEVRLRLEQEQAPPEHFPGLPEDVLLSLWATILITDENLGQPARHALYALSIFPSKPNTFSVGAALAVTAGPTEALYALDDCGLLESVVGQDHYMLHQVIADYAKMNLIDETAYKRGVDYFIRYISDHKTQHEGLDLERVNILAALDIASARELWEELVQGANMLYPYMETRGLFREAETYLRKAEQAARQLKDIEGLTTTLVNLGRALANLGSYESAEGYLQKALTLAPEAGNLHSEGDALKTLGVVYRNLGDYHQSIEFSERALAIYHEIDDRRGEGSALNNIGSAYGNLGEYHQAIDCYQQALVIVREIGNRRGEGDALNNLAIMYKHLGEYHRAIEHLELALNAYRDIGFRLGEGNAIGNLGTAYWNLNECHHAIKLLEQQLTLTQEIGDQRGEGNARNNLGLVYSDLGKLHRAADSHKRALAIQQKIGNRSGEADALCCLGIVYHDLGESRRAIEFYKQALAKYRELGKQRGEGISLSNIGSAYNTLGDFHSAIKHCEQALDIYQEIGFRLGEGDALHHIGNAYRGLEEFQTAVEYYEQSLHIHREIGHRNGEGNALWGMSLSFDKLGARTQAIGRAKAALEIYEQIEDPSAAEVREQLVKWNAGR